MKITNIANNRDKQGYLYSSYLYHPVTNHLQIEPWVAGCWLRLDEEINVPDRAYWNEKDLLDSLKENRIVDFEVPDKIKEEVVEEVKVEKPTEKIVDLGQPITELIENLTKFANATSDFTKIVLEASPVLEEIKTDIKEEKKDIKPKLVIPSKGGFIKKEKK